MAASQNHEEERLPLPNNLFQPDSFVPDSLRDTSRSPHPYHRKGSKRSEPHLLPTEGGDRLTPNSWPKTSSDSGTEADDESTGILKGLPAPPLRQRKGLRSSFNDAADRDSWLPLLQPWSSLGRSTSRSSRQSSSEDTGTGRVGLRGKVGKKRLEVLRRLLETGLLLSVGAVVLSQENTRSLAWAWRKELLAHGVLVSGLYAVYPLRRNGRLRLSGLNSFTIPSSFDPAPLLYPILIPIYTSLSLAHRSPALVLPNIILSLSSLPAPVIPLREWIHGHSVVHWLVTLIPIIVSEHFSADHKIPKPLTLRGLNSEVLTLVFPLHQALIPTLDFLLTTSILPAELQLLTSALVNLFLFASSPQAEILKALLWLGGLCIFISCRHVLRWEVALARIPSWKFRRSPSGSQSRKNLLYVIDHKVCQKLSRAGSSEDAMSDSEYEAHIAPISPRTTHEFREKTPARGTTDRAPQENGHRHAVNRRRHTISSVDEAAHSERIRTTPSGRRKRSMAPGLASFLSLTVPQAQVRKWLYALYVYAAVAVIIMGPVRKYVSERALAGEEPFGWALSYLLGNVSWFRFWVFMWNLEYWIPLPPRLDREMCSLGWMECLRQTSFGEANARLLIAAHCIVVIMMGLGVVFKLSSIVEVDTRRKVFHGMMVLMFLPTIYIDPAFCALALALVLSIFLLLDLFRASQMPPISRPLTYFLAPYVDGRDHRGPVIISHIFLLIGCSIPLWLSLADIPRSEDHPWGAWDVQFRDVSMVSGVVCVGLGDAAASLVGRRFGRRKWFWGGGKSLEGSVAFAAAVTGGLVFSRLWLAAGQWAVHVNDEQNHLFWLWTVCKAIIAAAGTSATEAILTGCNDNVVVPIVLWLLVRGLGL
ncbi:phosphatidate cytidylyltransferase [Aspergillus bombycis]|uniref:dolichol kinase n=1 Tax=Aspergillus bombycis TaxID=109264 RepID=A0A1F7ZKV7_9EURO|nr:phosphatidate cytidylyltransferase [Aspergillus bombycis]OGM40061.1 phosphatidate cytidylyltransferase [Aspergillus bombycis]